MQAPGRACPRPCSSSRALRDLRLVDCQTVIRDGIDKNRNKPGREIVTHPGDDLQFGTWDLFGSIAAGLQRDKRILGAVND